MSPLIGQLDLFDHVLACYAAAPDNVLSNQQLYREVAERAGVSSSDMAARVPVGSKGELHNPVKHRLRWWQQDLRRMEVLERVTDERGLWQLTEKGGRQLHRARAGLTSSPTSP